MAECCELKNEEDEAPLESNNKDNEENTTQIVHDYFKQKREEIEKEVTEKKWVEKSKKFRDEKVAVLEKYKQERKNKRSQL